MNKRIEESWKTLMDKFRAGNEPNFLKWMDSRAGEEATTLHEYEVNIIRAEENSAQLEMNIK